LVPTGKVNDVGALIRTNVDESYRTGIELDGSVRLSAKFLWNANVALSQNKIKDFNEVLYDYGVNFDEYNEVVTRYSNTDIAFSPNLIAGSTFTYSPLKGLEFDLLTKYVGSQYLDNTSNESRKIDAYLVNDLRVSYSFKPSFMREVSFSLLANNIFNTQYSSNGYTYGYLGGSTEYRQNYYFPQAGRNYLAMLALRF
jgi:iron complex outermembrane recepter protein